jgi:hypothetical protein
MEKKKLGIVVPLCYFSCDRKLKIGRSRFRPDWAKSETLSPK